MLTRIRLYTPLGRAVGAGHAFLARRQLLRESGSFTGLRVIYYAATVNEAPFCRGADVVVIGGGNSAGQAAVFLAGIGRKVYLLIRGDDLYKSMSAYLARRIEQTPNIEVLVNTTVKRMSDDGRLREIEIVNSKTGEVRHLRTPALFCFIGAVPRTEWRPPEIKKDRKQFVRTGEALAR